MSVDAAPAMPCSAAAERNKDPILDVLRGLLPASGLVLEIASGSGQHVVHFANALPRLTWQPSEPDARLRAWIDARVREDGLANVRPAIALDARALPWPVEPVDAIVCINMIHISPWSATQGLMAGASTALRDEGVLCVYGPFCRDGRHTSMGNAAFDAELRARDAAWGLRDTRDVVAQAAGEGLALERLHEMPANNLILAFRKAAA